MRVKMSKQPPPAPTASAVGPCPTVIQTVRRPGTGSLPSTIALPDHPSSLVFYSLFGCGMLAMWPPLLLPALLPKTFCNKKLKIGKIIFRYFSLVFCVSCNCFRWVQPLWKQRVKFGSSKTSLSPSVIYH